MTDKYGSSVEALEGSAPGAHIREGTMLNGDKSEEELKKIAEAFIQRNYWYYLGNGVMGKISGLTGTPWHVEIVGNS